MITTKLASMTSIACALVCAMGLVLAASALGQSVEPKIKSLAIAADPLTHLCHF